VSDGSTHYEPAFTVRNAALLLVALWLVLWIVRLAVGDDLAIRDQERQCAYILDAWSNGRWLTQTDFFADIASKPPLYNWLGAAAVAVAGPGYLAFTMPTALATLLLTLLAWHWARQLWGPGVGLIAGILVLLPTVGPKMVAYVRPDGLFTLTIALTAYAWWRHWERGGGWWWPWLAAALGALTKGPLGLLLGSYGLLAAAWQRDPAAADGGSGSAGGDRRSLSRMWPAGLAIYLLLAGGWFLWAWSIWGQPLIDRMIFRELVGAAVASYDSTGGIASQFWKAPLYLLWRTLPWCVFTVLALSRVFRQPEQQPSLRRAERFLACWLLAGVATFSLGSHQRGDLIWPLVLPAAMLAAREIGRRAEHWPQWARTRLGPLLLAVTLLTVTVVQVSDGQPKKSVYAAALARAIDKEPGRYFPVSYAVKYTTQAHLGILRYKAESGPYLAALAGSPAIFVAVEDPAAVVQQVAAAGGRAWILLRTRGGWGIVANRSRWDTGSGVRLLMGPVSIEVGNAQWRAMQGRRLQLVPNSDGMPIVTIVNNGPYREPFVVSLEGAAPDLLLQLSPHTRVSAAWRNESGWHQVVQASEAPARSAQ
jgi:hypothetical protein